MRRVLVVSAVALALAVAAGVFALCRAEAPPPLSAVTPETFGELVRAFNDGAAGPRVLALLSPT